MKDENLYKNIEFYKGKRVLVTGHTGFKGAWLTAVLNFLGADAAGYALAPEPGCLYEKIGGDELIRNVTGDLLDSGLLGRTVQMFQPEIVLHLAAFGFIKECFMEPLRAYRTNLMGSAVLLETLRNCPSVKSIVLVSTDKVYKNKGDGASYQEEDALDAADPYSCSKICMEYLARDYRVSYFQTDSGKAGIAVVRASNVLAGGDHVKTRLIPSILKSVSEGSAVQLRNPSQTRPWQSVLDALDAYLTVARMMYEKPSAYAGEWNIGPGRDGIRPVSWVFDKIRESFEGLDYREGGQFQVAESKTLGLDIQKALDRLEWMPRMSCEETVRQTAEFFKCQTEGQKEREICTRMIAAYYGQDSV